MGHEDRGPNHGSADPGRVHQQCAPGCCDQPVVTRGTDHIVFPIACGTQVPAADHVVRRQWQTFTTKAGFLSFPGQTIFEAYEDALKGDLKPVAKESRPS